MSDIGLILKSIDYIETHLADVVMVADIAASVSFSLYHFSRVFNRITHHTPYDYLMRRRLSEATRSLLETDRKIIDIAFEYQFNAPETFSRAFKRAYLQPPRQVKSSKNLDERLLMTKPTLEYLDFLNSYAIKPIPLSLPAMRIAGIANQIDMRIFSKESRTLRTLLEQQLPTSSLAVGPRKMVGILIYSSTYDAKHAMFLAGTIMRDDEIAPPFFIQKDLPDLDFACFDIPDHPQAIRYIRKYVYQTWWPKATSAPLPVYEVEYFSKPTGNQSTNYVVLDPHSLCFPMPVE